MEITVAVIPAAGKSSRMNGVNKIFAPLHGRPLISHTLIPFFQSRLFAAVALILDKTSDAVRKNHIENILSFLPPGPELIVCDGGATRRESVFNGLAAVEKMQPSLSVIHDGARPLITVEDLKTIVESAKKHRAASFAVPPVDTIVESAGNGKISSHLDRNTLYQLQTPQAFHFNLLMEAHRKAANDGRRFTDDTAVVALMGVETTLVPGRRENIKVTTPDDLAIAEMILAGK